MKKLFTLLLVALVGLLPAVAETAVFDFEDLTTLDPTPNPNKTAVPANRHSSMPTAHTLQVLQALKYLSSGTPLNSKKQSGKTWLNAYSNSTYTFTPAEGYKITKSLLPL